MRRIGVLGGTFDPIHYGHLVIACDARAYLDLEKVLFVPAYQPPHKPEGTYSTFRHRTRMLQLAIAGGCYFELCLIEEERCGPSYTVDTLRDLQHREGPDTRIYFIIGMDSLADLPEWHNPEELIRHYRVVVAERAGYHLDLDALETRLPGLGGSLEGIDTPELSISSTDLQRRVQHGLPIRYQVPPSVERYILAHGLYREDWSASEKGSP